MRQIQSDSFIWTNLDAIQILPWTNSDGTFSYGQIETGLNQNLGHFKIKYFVLTYGKINRDNVRLTNYTPGHF